MKTSIRLLCVVMALLMVIGLVACGKGNTKKTTTTAAGDTATLADGDTTTPADGDTTTPADGDTTVATNSDGSVNVTQNGTTKKGVTATTKKGATTTTKKGATTTTKKGATTTKATTTHPMTDLSLDQVMAKMPANLKNTTFNIFYWEDPHCNNEGDYADAFSKKYGIKLKFTLGHYESYVTELVEQVSTGKACDMAYMLCPAPARVQALQSLDCTGFDFNDKFWSQASLKDYTFNNIRYAVSANGKIDALGVLYNTKIMSEFCSSKGLTEPYDLWKNGKWTWDALEDMGKKWGDKGTDYFGASFCPLNLMMLNYGQNYVMRNAKGEYVDNSSSAKLSSAWTKTLKLVEEGVVHKEVWKMNEFMTGKCLFFFAGTNGGAYKILNNGLDYGYKLYKMKNQLGMLPVPSDKYGTYTPIAEYAAYGVPKGAKNPKVLPYYLRYTKGQNMDSKFLNDKTKEVFNAIQKNVTEHGCYNTDDVITEDSGIAGGGMDFAIMQSGSASQVKKLINQFQGSIQDAVTKANKQVAKFTAN